MKPKSTIRRFLALAGSSLLTISYAHAADGTWNVDANGLWSGAGNWTPGIADGSGFTANFTNDIITNDPTTVSLDGDRTLTNVVFGDSDTATAASWILDNNAVSTNNLILAGTTPTITVNALGTNKTATISAIIQGTVGLRKSGAGKLILTAANTYTGATTINAGTLQLGNGGAGAAQSSTSFVNDGTLAFNNSNTGGAMYVFGNAITGSGAVTLLAGNVGLYTGANTYSGGFTLAGGYLATGSSAASIGTGTLTLAGGTLSTSTSGGAGSTLTTTNANVWSGNFNLDSRVTGGSMVWNNNGTVLLSGGSRIVTGQTTPNLNLGNVVSDGGNNYGLTFNTMNSVTLSGANTYGGGTTMGAGTLNINNESALGTGKLTISGAMTLNNSTAGAITLTTNNAQDWNADFTFTGTRSLDMGTGAVTINANRIVTVNANTLTVGGIGQSGTRTLTKAGRGTLVLTGTNSYTGGTIVNAGTLQIGDGTLAGTMTSTGALTMGGGIFRVLAPAAGGSSQTVASLVTTAATNSTIRLTPGASGNTTLTITSNTLTTGAGSTVNFDYSGGTTVGGTLGNNYVVWNPTLTNGIIGPAYSVTDSGGTGFATISGGNVVRLTDPGGAGLPVSGGVATDSYFVGSGYSTTVTTTPGSLVEALSGAVAASNVTVDTTGLASGANLALGTNILTLGAGMAFNGANPYEITGSSPGGLKAAASAGTIFLNNGNTSTVTINAPILANGASILNVNGTGTTILGGANTYSGATILNGGTTRFSGTMAASAVTINNAAVAQIGAATGLSSTNTVTFGANTTGSLQLLGNSVTIGALSSNATVGTPVITNNNGGAAVANATITIDSGSNTTFAGVIQDGTGGGTLALAKSGAGTLILSGINTYSGGTIINGGVLSVTNDNQLGNTSVGITLNGGRLTLPGVNLSTARIVTVIGTGSSMQVSGNNNFTTSGKLTGSGTLTLNDPGGGGGKTFNFNATNNDFTGRIVLSGSAGLALNVNSLADSANNIAFTAGAGSTPFNYGTGAIAPLTLSSRAIEINSAAALNATIENKNTTHAITINSNLVATLAGAKTLTLTAAAGPTNVFAGNIVNATDAGSGTIAVTKSGAGTWQLTNTSNSYNGATTVSAGTLGFANGALGSVGTINASGGTLQWLSGNTQDISSRLAMTAATTSTFNTNGNNVTFATGFGGSTTGALTKNGNGTLLLNGTNTYTGLTTVSAGTLGGTGTIAGSVTVAAAGSLAPGASAGQLSIGGGLDISAPVNGGAGKLIFELGANTASSDRIAVTGTLTIGTAKLGFLDFNFSNIGWQDGAYTLITSGAISGTLDTLAANREGPIGAGLGTLSISGNNIILTVTGVGGGGNVAPTISDIANQSVPSGGNTGALAFTITDEDVNSVTPTGSSSNTGLVPNANIVFGGSGANRTVTVTPVSGQSGSATITVTLTDNGALTVQDTFTLTVTDNYLSWATANGVTGGENGDHDNDGVKNLVEYALVNGGERGVLSGYTITYTKRGLPYGTDLTYIIESSETLVGAWTDEVTHSPALLVSNPTISYTFSPSTPVKKFARLEVVKAP